MPTLKSLRQRLNSVTSTQKLTRAMKMVANAHLKRVQGSVPFSKEYASHIESGLMSALNLLPMNDTLPPLLAKNSEELPHLVVIFSSDKGLCGTYNLQVVGKTISYLRTLKQPYELILVGRKAGNYLSYLANPTPPQSFNLDYKDLKSGVRQLAKVIEEAYTNQRISGCAVIYTSFYSLINLVPEICHLLPFVPAGAPSLIWGVDPDPATFLTEASRLYIRSKLYQMAVSAKTSEEGARMLAMDNASRNAKDMLDKLSLTYNRTRQAAITKELIEIISGAESL